MFDNIIVLIPRWSPRRIMMDSEKAAMNVVDATFPAIEISGCFFHLTQSVQRFLQVKLLTQSMKIVVFLSNFIQNHGFKQKYETDITFADSIHKILALVFFEPTQVINGFESLCSELGEEYQEIIGYFEDNYIGRVRGRFRRSATFPINIWNMNTRVKNNLHRTNNNLEALH